MKNPTLRVPLDTASSGGQDSNEPHLRPPDAYLPEGLLPLLERRDSFVQQLSAAQTRQHELTSPALDQAAQEADHQATADGIRTGKPVKVPTAHRDQLAADRRKAAEDVAALAIVVRDLAGDLLEARHSEGSDPVWRAHVADTRTVAESAITALIALVEALVHVEAVDTWLLNVGPRYNPATGVHVADLVPGLANRGVRREEAGAIDLTALLAALRDDVL